MNQQQLVKLGLTESESYKFKNKTFDKQYVYDNRKYLSSVSNSNDHFKYNKDGIITNSISYTKDKFGRISKKNNIVFE